MAETLDNYGRTIEEIDRGIIPPHIDGNLSANLIEGFLKLLLDNHSVKETR